MSFPSDDSSYTTSSTSFTNPICDNDNNADYTPAEFPRSPSPEFPHDDNGTYTPTPAPAPEFNHDTAGWILNPDGTAQFVANRAAHFAQHPEAQASTEADMRVWQAELDRRAQEERVRARGERAWAKMLRRDERVREFEGVVHGCVGGWVVGTCGGCAGTGREGGGWKNPDTCKRCNGKGVTGTLCDKCEEERKQPNGNEDAMAVDESEPEPEQSSSST